MKAEDQLKLSFYKEISKLDESHNISLVKRIDTNEIFVKKVYEDCQPGVFDVLKENIFEGIPRLHECIYDEDTNTTITVEEHINGKPLNTLLNQNGNLSEEHTLMTAVSLCNILGPLHRHTPPIIHRDIKPSNVIIDDNWKVYLVDFDASKLYSKGHSRDTELLGTETYAAPEQYGFRQSDARTDIYALGILMREMLTGSPNENESESSADSSQTFGNIDLPDNNPFTLIIKRCTAMDPNDRYQDVIELKSALLALKRDYMTSHQEEETIEGKHRSYALPGFRNNNILVKTGAALLYLFAWYIGFSYTEAGMSVPDLWVNRICLFITLIALILLYGNYLDIREKLPLTRSSNWIIRIAGYILYTVLILFTFASITVLADRFL